MPRLVFWRIDDALVLLIPFSFGILFGSILLMIGAFANVWLYRRIRKQNGQVNFKAWSYWTFGLGTLKVPSHIRRFRR